MYNYPGYYFHQQPLYPHSPTVSAPSYYRAYGLYEHQDQPEIWAGWEQHYPHFNKHSTIPRDYPTVDSKILSNSIVSSNHLLKDASLLTQKLAEPAIARELMTHAQQGNQKEVDRIVHSFGCKSMIVTSYSPSSVKFTIEPGANDIPCCEVTLLLKWGQ
ncbi:hypothetical protein GQF01_10645 [Paenibacillus sp. 5J-6]|uniref:Uncharacterized protein n=1 Tax=Paenibacillus silvestris TaxID=2606219 RepID=A0A6L8UWH4_9BACL|nr:hypothetical protein [Paenibacillus silvestris]MZQ82568.1 hypothetical protein [Paenibacillus silvestris]